MKKKVLLTIGLVLLIGVFCWGIVDRVIVVVQAIDSITVWRNSGLPNDYVQSLIQDCTNGIIKNSIFMVCFIASVIVFALFLICLWKKEIKNISYSYEDYKLKKEEKRKQKVEQKKKKLEEKLNKLK